MHCTGSPLLHAEPWSIEAVFRAFAFAPFICSFLGCAQSDGPLQVTGTVKFVDGSPVTGETGNVSFHPVGEGKSASASIEPDGSFRAMTERPGDGMQPGAYQVTLHVYENYREQTLAVAEKYTAPETSPLKATVDADHTQFDFVVER